MKLAEEVANNEKGISFALIATLLVGCGSSNTVNYSTEVTDGDKTIISGDDVEITKMIFTIIF
ncbi:hypothetical protein SD457_05440 [Coprobacillaceae bacterium CR2/5/TPMF4]|nr:hypothetical protein SD457_05440 [Coprobacillaceae bacterium CR2/5/TPMF4]